MLRRDDDAPPCPPALRSRLLPAHHHHGGAFGTRWPVNFRVCVCGGFLGPCLLFRWSGQRPRRVLCRVVGGIFFRL